jgi:hypothetical protein
MGQKSDLNSSPLLDRMVVAYKNKDSAILQNLYFSEIKNGTTFTITSDDELEMVPFDGNMQFVVTRNLCLDLGAHGCSTWQMLCVLEGFSVEDGEAVPKWAKIGPPEEDALEEMLDSLAIPFPPIRYE